MLVAVMLMVWFERKIIAGMQNRIGPNKAGPWGILQTLADGMKLFFKEYIHPERADRFVFKLAPYLAFVPVFLMFAIVPLGGDFSNGNDGVITILGEKTYLQLADPPIGILLMLALCSIAVYGAMLAGWSSGSKYPLLGSVRASAQMVSYEAALGLSIAAVLVVTGTLSTNGIVVGPGRPAELEHHRHRCRAVRHLHDRRHGRAEPPAVRPRRGRAGARRRVQHRVRVASRFALFYLAEFMNTVMMSTIIVTLFLGGPQPVCSTSRSSPTPSRARCGCSPS